VRNRVVAIVAAAVSVIGAQSLRAQIDMPDPKEMAGIPRPVDDLPNGSVSVRLIRGELSNRIVDHPVELAVGGKPRTARTDGEGRAQFDQLPAGVELKAVAVVDGERLESQPFPAPSRGGIRVMLVATDKEREARKAAEAAAPAVVGEVVFGGQSRIIIEPGDEEISVYFVLDMMNNSRAPVKPATVIDFEMPEGATGASLLGESSKLALVTGTHVRVNGPLPPGKTSVTVGSRIPVKSGSLEIRQVFPAKLEQLTVIVSKIGSVQLTSPQIERQEEGPVDSGQTVIFGTGGGVAAGQPIVLQLTNLPHHSQVPRYIAVALAAAIVLVGIGLARRTVDSSSQRDERKKLGARREKLLQDLARLEEEHRDKGGDRRYAARREDLVASLERVYGALDSSETSAESGDRSGPSA
jgi:hypothetical protein